MMRRVLVTGFVVAAGLLSGLASAQGTKLWSVDRYDAMEKGSPEDVAVRSDGRLEAGPSTSLLYATGKNYVWSLTADTTGNGYVGLGGTASGSAIVMKVAPNGKATQIFTGKELAVQALRVSQDGSVIIATSPDGKVYRVPLSSTAVSTPAVIFDPATTEERPKYIWDLAVGKKGEVYIASGAPAVVYRVPAAGGKPEVLFKTADQHIRCLLLSADGTLWAGSDGAGVIYRFATETPGAKPFAAYSATRREITALATDPEGNIYASGVGAKGHTSLPPLPVTGNVAVTITFSQPGSSSAASANTLVPDGSEIYKISTDGSPQRLLTLKEDVVYALSMRNGSLLAATGNRGRVYRIDTKIAGRFTDVAHLDAAQAMAFTSVNDGLLVATSNSGKVFHMADTASPSATYTSEVFDAQSFAQWGRAEVRAGSTAGYDLFVRSGNVESPLMGWSDWVRVGADGGSNAPAGRFVQWKAVLRGGGSIDSVALNYLQKNIPPVVDQIVVQPGARMAANTAPAPAPTVQVAFTATTGPQGINVSPDTAPLIAQKDKTGVTARWLAHDDNGDDLVFAVWYRGQGEANWRLLKDKISERFYSFDSALLPDGNYELKVIASDTPMHTDAEALTGEKTSEAFVVDTTPPVPGVLTVALLGSSPGKIHATLEARDATSPIAHAEYSLDAGPWQYLEPVGKVSDSLSERYDFIATVPAATSPVSDAKEHVLAVRVYDRYENVVAVKAIVH